MTENKRFEIKPSAMYNNKYVIHDSKKEYIFPVLDSTLNYMFCKALNELSEENEQLKSTIAQLIEQNRKNTELLLSDIRILEKALWCSGCENDYGRLKELRKEFMR